jgi:hypothetical protein
MRLRALGSDNEEYIRKLEKDRAWRLNLMFRLKLFAVIGLIALLAGLYLGGQH